MGNVGLRGSSLGARVALTIVLLGATSTGVAALAGCGSILGIDDGIADQDAVATDVGAGDDGGDDGGGDAIAPADGDAGDRGSDASDAACTPDPNWCQSHCGNGPDNCGQQRSCTNNCAPGWFCDAGANTCDCTTDPSWCNGRCQMTTDNCGRPIDCGVCDAGACTQNTCGCSPQPDPCGTMACGSTTDSCGHAVNCGVNGTTACANGGECDGGVCCTPNSNPCAGLCGGVSVDDGCGRQVQCPSTCGGDQECTSNNQCCTPSPACAPNTCNTSDSCGVLCNCTGGGTCDPMSGQCCPNTVCMNGCCSPGQMCAMSTGLCCTPGTCDMTNPCYDTCGNQVSGCCSSDAGTGDAGVCQEAGAPCNGDPATNCCSEAGMPCTEGGMTCCCAP